MLPMHGLSLKARRLELFLIFVQFHSYWKIFELIWIILNFLPIEMEGGIMYLFSIEDPLDFKAFKRNPGGGAGGESKILGVS